MLSYRTVVDFAALMEKQKNMRIDLHIHDESEVGVPRKLDEILTLLRAIKAQEITMDAATRKSLDDLNTAVAEDTTVTESVKTLLEGLSAQIAALKDGVTDPAVIAAIDAASEIVKTNSAKASAAVVANTNP